MKILLTVLTSIAILSGIQACAPVIVAGTVAGAGATIAADRREPEKILEDEAVEIQATDYIYSNEDFGKHVRIEVTSFNGTVLLSGESPSEAYKNTIVQRIGKMRPVKRVIDNIEVKPILTFNDRTNDFWISSKVRSNLIAHRGLLTRTKVITSGNKVYLMGLVTNSEAQEIVKLVNQVEGIAEVVPLFESLDGSLDPNFKATTRIAQKSDAGPPKKTLEQKLDEEDEFIVQPYVLQPPIRLTDEQQ